MGIRTWLGLTKSTEAWHESAKSIRTWSELTERIRQEPMGKELLFPKYDFDMASVRKYRDTLAKNTSGQTDNYIMFLDDGFCIRMKEYPHTLGACWGELDEYSKFMPYYPKLKVEGVIGEMGTAPLRSEPFMR